MAAKRFRRGARTEYNISLDADDISQGNKAYVGKLRYFHAIPDTVCLYLRVNLACASFLTDRAEL